MKKQYILAILLMLGASVVTTMAFTTGTLTTEEVSIAYTIDTYSLAVVTSVKVTPLGPDKMIITLAITPDGTNTYDLLVAFDFSSDVTWTATTDTIGNSIEVSDQTDDYFTDTNIAVADTSVTFTASGTAIWLNTDGLFISINNN